MMRRSQPSGRACPPADSEELPSDSQRRRCLGWGAAWLAVQATPACSAVAPEVFAPQSMPADVSFSDVSVHDPAVLRVGHRWYVFGSHLAAAQSDDLLHWRLLADGVVDSNPLFPQVTQTLADAFAWAQVTDLWAPDVQRLPTGHYAFYYDACKGDAPRSALGLATSPSPTGPFEDQGILLRSGMWGELSEDGTTIYDAQKHPNVVDPQAFADAQGRWWLLYGSYSGGLFILRLDAATGRPVPGQGYGTRLVGGNHARIEGGYIQWIPEVGWYYLFLSFGGLTADGGYNIRVARSRQPDGPYLDGMGRRMTDCQADPSLPLFDDVSIAPYGQKLLGSHQFELADGETGAALGYVSPGHNSVSRSTEEETWLIFFHTRFPGTGEFHQVRVHAFHIQSEGWPVVAPLRYVPRRVLGRQATRPIDRHEVVGGYQVVNHGKDISAALKTSVGVFLEQDGQITGAWNGRWWLEGRSGIRLQAADGATYVGVLSRQWHPNTRGLTLCLSAQSAQGQSLWGIHDPMSPRTGGLT